VRKVIVRENARVSIPSTQKSKIFRFLIFPIHIRPVTSHHQHAISITWYDGIVKRMCMELSTAYRLACNFRDLAIDCHRIPKLSESRRVALFAGRRGELSSRRILSSASTRLLLSRAFEQATNNTSTNTMSSRPDVNESTETTSPQRRTGARRGPRVSNACVNCRRRKVCGRAGFPCCKIRAMVELTRICRSSVRARSRGVNTAPRTRSIACTRNLSSGKGLFVLFCCLGLSTVVVTYLTPLFPQTDSCSGRAFGTGAPAAEGLNVSFTIASREE
jgi:hypothetical protein